MAQGYSDPSRASDPHALPDVEVFYINASSSSVNRPTREDGSYCPSGWYYWYCLPGCLPDSEPFGPFKTEREAWDDIREQNDHDDDSDSEPEEV